MRAGITTTVRAELAEIGTWGTFGRMQAPVLVKGGGIERNLEYIPLRQDL